MAHRRAVGRAPNDSRLASQDEHSALQDLGSTSRSPFRTSSPAHGDASSCGSATFATLHPAIQDGCGWANAHVYEFRASGDYAGKAIAGLRLEDGEDDLSGPLPSAASTRLTRYFGRDSYTTCLYVYDFGDDWMHDVQLNDVVSLRETFKRRLLGGEHAFPPDDCGVGAAPDAIIASSTSIRLIDIQRYSW